MAGVWAHPEWGFLCTNTSREGSDNVDDDERMLMIDGVTMVVEDNDYGNICYVSNQSTIESMDHLY